MMCDILHCNESATFSLPEITLGTLPGAGGTQRLLRAVGKSRAFEMILTGDRMSAEEALEKGLVSKVWKDDQLMPGVVKLAERIADMSCTALMTAKQAVNVTQKQVLDALHIEKALYHMSFDSDSFKEGVSAFVEKRKANF